MTKNDSPVPNPSSQWLCVLLFVGVLAILIELLSERHGARVAGLAPSRSAGAAAQAPARPAPNPGSARPGSPAPSLTAEEIVRGKVQLFAEKRRELARQIARRLHQTVPPEIERFFDAIEAGHWDEIKAQWDPLARQSGQYENSTNHWDGLDAYWPAVLDVYGVAEQAHLWPPQQLLDYGNAVLDALRPGMVYVGGTDNGRWIPELMNETSGAEPHIIVTQNALADARYLDFVNTLYSDQMTPLTSADSQAAFQAYVADAQQRLQHDQQFPDEPKQVLPGENIQVVDGKTQVGGMVSVMAINQRLLQTLMQNNPNLSFAMEESFPLKGMYPDAAPLGPLMELGGGGAPGSFTSDQATQSLEYWQTTAQQVLTDPEAVNSTAALKSYSHDAAAAANLLAAHNFNGQAEQAYNVALQLWPGNPESVSGLADVLASTGRDNEARQLLQDFARNYPDQQQTLQRSSAYWRLIAPAQAGAGNQ